MVQKFTKGEKQIVIHAVGENSFIYGAYLTWKSNKLTVEVTTTKRTTKILESG